MVAPVRFAGRAVSSREDLLADHGAWGYFAAIRALAAEEKGGVPVGRSVRIEDDRIRFRQAPSLQFEASEIRAVEIVETPNGEVVELTQTFFGPFGAKGALPQHVTEDALLYSADLQPFLDLFTHRMVALLYRAWETTRIAVSRDRGGEDPYCVWLNALFGQGMTPLQNRDALPDDLKRYAAGWLSAGRPTVPAIEGLMEIVAGVRVTVEEFVPEWLPIPVEEQARLGLGPMRLGEEVIIGARYFSVQSRLRLRTEKLSWARFDSLLPTGDRHPVIRDAMRNLAGLSLAWDLQLVLDGAEVPKLALDGARRLGWDTWLSEDVRFAEAVDVVLT